MSESVYPLEATGWKFEIVGEPDEVSMYASSWTGALQALRTAILCDGYTHAICYDRHGRNIATAEPSDMFGGYLVRTNQGRRNG